MADQFSNISNPHERRDQYPSQRPAHPPSHGRAQQYSATHSGMNQGQQGQGQGQHGQPQGHQSQAQGQQRQAQSQHGQLKGQHGQAQGQHGQPQGQHGQPQGQQRQAQGQHGQPQGQQRQAQGQHGQAQGQHGQAQSQHGQDQGQQSQSKGNGQAQSHRNVPQDSHSQSQGHTSQPHGHRGEPQGHQGQPQGRPVISTSNSGYNQMNTRQQGQGHVPQYGSQGTKQVPDQHSSNSFNRPHSQNKPYGTDTNRNKHTGEGLDKSYSKSREMPPQQASGQHTGQNKETVSQRVDPRYQNAKDARNDRSQYPQGRDSRPKGAAPPPPPNQSGNQQEGGGQRPGDGQGRYVGGQEHARPMKSDQAKMGGASYANQNSHGQSRDSVQGGYENRGYVQNEPRDDRNRQQQVRAHHQSTGDVNRVTTQNQNMNKEDRSGGHSGTRSRQDMTQPHHQSTGHVNYANSGHHANTGATTGQSKETKNYPTHHRSTGNISHNTNTGQYENARGTSNSAVGPKGYPDGKGNQASSSAYNIPHEVSKSNQDTVTMRGKDSRYQGGNPQPQAPPRRNKPTSAMDLSSSQGYAASSQNVAGMTEKSPTAPTQQHQQPVAGNSSSKRDRVLSDSSSNNKRKYERHGGSVHTGKQAQSTAPSAKRRDRMSSSTSQPGGPSSYHGTVPSQPDPYFDPTPPNRSMSMMVLPQQGSSSSPAADPTGRSHKPPLTRASSLPTISQQVSQGQHTGSMNAVNNPALYRSKSLLSMALQGVDANQNGRTTNLRHSASLASLVASNPNLARTASTYALYELQVEKGITPRDHYQTMVLSIVSIVIMPVLGWIVGALLLYFTVENQPNWRLDLYKAIRVNTRLFWGNVAFIGLSVLLWIIIIWVAAVNA